ncbi:MAG: GFA family protein [Paracoccus sp. (in: a-proteobacteria)]|nr:GFA family protein [Paracoccus sp. (in: a-proteobacteria)]
MTKVKGACLCSAVSYETDTESMMIVACHCSQCRKQSAAAFSVNVAVPMAALRMTGAPATFDDTGHSGLPLRRHFCATCGSPVFSDADAMPGVALIKAGTLDDPSWAQPQMNIWCGSALPWVQMGAEAACFDANLPVPA